MFRLGRFATARPVFLAPMAGFTDAAMRCICHLHGAALTFTEMVNASGLLRGSDATRLLLTTLPDEGPVAAHLYGADPDEMAAAAETAAASGRFTAIDVNAGCPVRKITANGCGAALMPKPALVRQIIERMVRAQPLPVTLKTRTGLRPGEVLAWDLLQAAEDGGASAITFHARPASQHHSGPVDLELLAGLVSRARIPVIGNGGIQSAADAQAMRAATGVDAVMVGRAAMGNPWVFNSVAGVYALPHDAPPAACPESPPPSPQQRLQALRQHLAFALRLHHLACRGIPPPAHVRSPHEVVATTFRCHLFRYLSGLRGAAHMRSKLSTYRTLPDILNAARECVELHEHFAARQGDGKGGTPPGSGA